MRNLSQGCAADWLKYEARNACYLESHGYPRLGVGMFWALAVLAEVFLFLSFARYFAHHDAKYLYAVAFLLASARWLLLGLYPDRVPVVVFSQALHAATAGVYHAVAVSLVHRLFPGRLESRGQALYTSLNFGVGTAFGAFLAGILWTSQGPAAAFQWSAAVAVAGAVVGFFAVRHSTPLDRQ